MPERLTEGMKINEPPSVATGECLGYDHAHKIARILAENDEPLGQKRVLELFLAANPSQAFTVAASSDDNCRLVMGFACTLMDEITGNCEGCIAPKGDQWERSTGPCSQRTFFENDKI